MPHVTVTELARHFAEYVNRVAYRRDLWLSATCVAHGLVMVTADERDFEHLPGLRWEVWAAA